MGEAPVRWKFERAQALGVRAWSRLQGLAIDSDRFRIRAHRACAIAALCDRLYVQLQQHAGIGVCR